MPHLHPGQSEEALINTAACLAAVTCAAADVRRYKVYEAESDAAAAQLTLNRMVHNSFLTKSKSGFQTLA